VLLLAFIVFHLLHFTTRQVDPAGWANRADAAGHYDIYGNMVASFRMPWVSAVYLVAMVVLGLHAWHGVWSFGRSLGVAPVSPQPLRRPVAAVIAVALWLGFSAVPLAVLFGIIR
jgi:succinate dehydrogenase / fumarate reductase cytochrome b subunit